MPGAGVVHHIIRVTGFEPPDGIPGKHLPRRRCVWSSLVRKARNSGSLLFLRKPSRTQELLACAETKTRIARVSGPFSRFLVSVAECQSGWLGREGSEPSTPLFL